MEFIYFEESWNKEGTYLEDPIKFPESSELGLQHRELNNNKLKNQ